VKKQSKTAAIRTLLTQGKTVADVAKKLKVKPAAVYQVRYRMRKEEQEAREIDGVFKTIEKKAKVLGKMIDEAAKKEPVDIYTADAVKKQSKTAAIRALLEQGKTVAEIGEKLKVKPTAVYEAAKREPVDIYTTDPVNTPLAYSAGMRGKYAVPEPVQEAVQVFPDDPVNHPSHYMVGGIEVIDFIRAKNFSYLLGNVIKYVSRSQHKGHYLEDLKKAQWYLTRAIEEAQK